MVGPLSVDQDPHAWDLCAAHALRITAPRGWELVRHPDIDVSAEDSDLTALLDAVTGGPVGGRRPPALVDADRLRRLGVADPGSALAEVPADPADTSRPHLRVVQDPPRDGRGSDGA